MSDRLKLRTQSGFTIVELLVVFAIAAVLIAVVPPSLERMRSGAEYRSTLRSLGSELRSARQLALREGRVVLFEINLAERHFGFAGGRRHPLPSSLQVEVTVAGNALEHNQVATIRFLPDGGATGGSIDVLRQSGEGSRVRVDWFTGRANIEVRMN